MNAISLARIQQVHPELQRRVASLCNLVDGMDIEVTQGLRTWDEQNALYAQGRTAPGNIVTDAPGGYSAHNFGYAVDLVPEDITPGQPDWNAAHPAWQRMLSAGRSAGLAEGAQWRTFPDNPHFYLQELAATPTDEMRQDFKQVGLEGLWQTWNDILVRT